MLAPAKLLKTINQLDWYQGALRLWVDELALAEGEHVLEIGCETGSLSHYLAGKGYQLSAVDRSSTMIETAKRDQSKVNFQIADATKLPFNTAQFGAVIAASLINIVSDQHAVIAEMVRVCKPGGTLSILVPKQGFADAQLEVLIRDLELSGFSAAVLRVWHHSAPKMRFDDIKSLFDKTNFKLLIASDTLQGMIMAVSARKKNA